MNVSAWVFLGSAGALISAIVGAIVLLRKMGPEVNRIQIESASELTRMAKSLAEQYRIDAIEMRERNRALDDRLTEQARQLGAATQRISQLEKTAAEVSTLREEITTLREERTALLRENRDLRSRVAALEAQLPSQRHRPD